jgi:hypothetical protein
VHVDWLGLSGLVIGLVGIIAAYAFYKKSVRTKVLGVAYTAPIPIVLTLEDIDVSYKGATLKALSRVYVLLWNRGTAPIESADFLFPIAFKYKDPLVTLEISDKDAAARVKLDNDANTLQIELLRPGEAVLIHSEVASETFAPDIDIQMKSSDMSTFIGAYRSAYPGLIGFVVTMLILGLQTIVMYRISPPQADWETKVPDNIFLFMATFVVAIFIYMAPALAVGTIIAKLSTRFLQRSTNRVAWRFSEIKLAALGMHGRASAFRKFMAGIKNR